MKYLIPISILLLSSCSEVVGDYCIIYKPVGPFDPDTAKAIVETDREDAEAIRTNQENYKRCD